VPGVVEADQGRRSTGLPLHDGDRAVVLIEPDPTPDRSVKHVANEPAEKAGFTYEGTARNAGIVHAGRVDLAIYSPISGDLRP